MDIASLRRYRSRAGISGSAEQQLADDLGVFGRIGTAAGDVEAYEFTDVDRTIELGVSLKGRRWQRPDDTASLAVIQNDLSAARARFLNAGGLGILVGDGRLPHPGPEHILETFYSLAVGEPLTVTVDFQRIGNPAYNRDRGPVSVLALRVHAQF
jgi:high affinity Mn2+ porin